MVLRVMAEAGVMVDFSDRRDHQIYSVVQVLGEPEPVQVLYIAEIHTVVAEAEALGVLMMASQVAKDRLIITTVEPVVALQVLIFHKKAVKAVKVLVLVVMVHSVI